MIRSLCSPRAYRSIGTTTIAAVFFLILVGGIVRASGAGMGCPDWPKCFDRWIPPTDESQLPPDYQEIYKDRGYADTTFNAVKTWTEYINRLVGVTIGFLIFLTLLSSLGYLRSDPAVTGLSLASFLLVGFQGWLGSVVVSSNLVPYLVTLHMVLALVLVAVLILAVARSQRQTAPFASAASRPALGALLWIVLALSLVQVVLGTQVREQVDELSASLGTTDRTVWVEHFGTGFYVHRTLSLLVLALNVHLARTILKQGGMS
ncbi:MAG: COX15/CtaA family protein, partial [Candidatus Hydrogenedentes bacterium]|nr:COX15/CtaA family protein [Candidatus Hydrogenedentota bacterium]